MSGGAVQPWAGVIAVAAGSAIGALLRWTAGMLLNPVWSGFPLGTWLVNCIGGLLIGVAMVWFAGHGEVLARLFLVTGLLGGFTTFSAFSAESLELLHRGQWAMALVHTLAHVVGALACTAIGFAVMRALLRA